MRRRIHSKKRPSKSVQERRAKKAAATRRANRREAELARIERALGEEFESLSEARAALKEEQILEPTTIEEYEDFYDDAVDYEDQGEYDSGVDTGEAAD